MICCLSSLIHSNVRTVLQEAPPFLVQCHLLICPCYQPSQMQKAKSSGNVTVMDLEILAADKPDENNDDLWREWERKLSDRSIEFFMLSLC